MSFSPIPTTISFDTLPSPTDDLPAGPSIEKHAPHLDYVFNFQIVVFEVENTLFQVLRNGFNVPGTAFEAMFALPQTQSDNTEGSLENPIHLPGIKADHFRSFLRILYPFIDQTPVDEFDEWVAVLNLASMWFFKEIRARAIIRLSELIKQKKLMERIALAREYRVAEWLQDAYLELTQKTPLDLEELRPAEPYSSSDPLERNWEADAKKWEATSKDWETLARIFHLQTVAASNRIMSNSAPVTDVWGQAVSGYRCDVCGLSYSSGWLCQCRILPMVSEAFRGELEGLREDPGLVEHLSPNSAAPPTVGVSGVSGKKGKKKR